MRSLLSTTFAAAIAIFLSPVAHGALANSFFENFDTGPVTSLSDAGNSIAGWRVDDSLPQNGTFRSPGWYNHNDVLDDGSVNFSVNTNPPGEPPSAPDPGDPTLGAWSRVPRATDFTQSGGDGALMLGGLQGPYSGGVLQMGTQSRASTNDHLGVGTYTWDVGWEDYHRMDLPQGVSPCPPFCEGFGNDFNFEDSGVIRSPGEKRMGVVLLSDLNTGDVNLPERGIQINVGTTSNENLFVAGKKAGLDDVLWRYNCPFQGAPGCYDQPETFEPEMRPWELSPNDPDHAAGDHDNLLRASMEATIEESAPGVYLLDVSWARTGDPLVKMIDDLDVSAYLTDVLGGQGVVNGYWNITTGDSGFGKWDNLNYVGPGGGLLLGDANNDGTVTADDLIAVQQNFGNVGPNGDGTDLGDANDDGAVTADDLIAVQQNFGNTLGASGGAVPEPAVSAAVMIGALAAAGIRRR